jgi:hypothetical protein
MLQRSRGLQMAHPHAIEHERFVAVPHDRQLEIDQSAHLEAEFPRRIGSAGDLAERMGDDDCQNSHVYDLSRRALGMSGVNQS